MIRVLAILLAMAGCQEIRPFDDEPAPIEDGGASALDCGPQTGRVVRVVDGDTLVIEADCSRDDDCHEGGCAGGVCAKDQRIRLVAIETGEIHSRTDCFGQEAFERLEDLALGRRVELVYDDVAGCTGDRGRLLAYVMLDGEPVQTALVREGYACLDWHRGEAQKTQTPFFDELDAAQTSAQRAGLRIWTPAIRDACGELRVHEDCR